MTLEVVNIIVLFINSMAIVGMSLYSHQKCSKK
jgi:hypothetical protein